MARLLTLSVCVLALVATLAEAESNRIHVTAKIVEQTFTGDLADPQIGDKLITSVELFDEHDKKVGTGAGVCTIVSAPPPDIRIQCLSTAVFPNGQIIFGGFAPSLPEVGAVGRFGILGGTDDFCTARGEVTIVVLTPELQDATFDLE
jgi:Allene oxide cyclase barrel like domain